MQPGSDGVEVARVARRYVSEVTDTLSRLDAEGFGRVAAAIMDAQGRGGQTFVFGNGGSASVAAHFALSLTHDLPRRGGRSIAAVALTDGIVLTAIANDRGVDQLFADQLRHRLRPADVVVAFSASGRSRNVLSALPMRVTRGRPRCWSPARRPRCPSPLAW